jgi:hypothetical protein
VGPRKIKNLKSKKREEFSMREFWKKLAKFQKIKKSKSMKKSKKSKKIQP